MDRKKIIGITIVTVLLLSAVGVVLYLHFSKSSSSGNANIQISGLIKGPNNIKINLPQQFQQRGKIAYQPVNIFVNNLVDSVVPYHQTQLYWESVKINNVSLSIDNKTRESSGAITDTRTLSNILGSSFDKIDVEAVFLHSCLTDDKARVASTCDVCNGEAPVCTGTGWVCTPGQQCPSVEEQQACCAKSGSPGLYTQCDSSTGNKVKCGPCPGTKDCGDPGCKGVGAKCTATGWVCSEGVKCPSEPERQSCCTEPGEFGTCVDNEVVCVKCPNGFKPGEGPCDPDCNASSPVCGSDGYLHCQKNTKCPTREQLDKLDCCKSTPDTPYAICNVDKDGKATVTCTTCAGAPGGPVGTCGGACPCNCQGQGWICTSTGYKCQSSGVACPPESIWNELNCCGGVPDTEMQCSKGDDGVCIKCGCVSGFHGCGPMGTCNASVKDPHNPKCCSDDIGSGVCSQNPVTGWECCESGSNCVVNGKYVCCPPGTACNGNTCSPICGKKSDGSDNVCDAGDECIIISGGGTAPPGSWKDPRTGDIYFCKPPESCSFGLPITSPEETGNYYPCWPLPAHSDEVGTGYCAGQDPTNAGEVQSCFNNYKDEKTCVADTKCAWVDILSTVAEDGEKGLEKINNDMVLIGHYSTPYGYWCDPYNLEAYPMQRVVLFPPAAGGKACTWENCWAQVSQPGIIDVMFNEKTGNCVGLQACDSTGGAGMTNSRIDPNTGKRVPNTPPSVLPPEDATFQTCGPDTKCAIDESAPVLCVPYESAGFAGTIQKKTWDCVADPATGDGTECELVYTGKGKYEKDDCLNQCKCATNFNRGSDGKCYMHSPGCFDKSNFGACGNEPIVGCSTSGCHESANLGGCGGTGSGWTGDCHGSCASGDCHCDCFLTQKIPASYNYCDYATKKWKECSTAGGCEGQNVQPYTGGGDGDAWRSGTGDCLSGDCEDSSYCKLP
uniref:Uncharacterized protein n=1 Tax=viral metagenome TaxID=1070528 RepID=A0A6C0EM07_9ZZZZ